MLDKLQQHGLQIIFFLLLFLGMSACTIHPRRPKRPRYHPKSNIMNCDAVGRVKIKELKISRKLQKLRAKRASEKKNSGDVNASAKKSNTPVGESAAEDTSSETTPKETDSGATAGEGISASTDPELIPETGDEGSGTPLSSTGGASESTGRSSDGSDSGSGTSSSTAGSSGGTSGTAADEETEEEFVDDRPLISEPEAVLWYTSPAAVVPTLKPLYFGKPDDELSADDWKILRKAAEYVKYGYAIKLEEFIPKKDLEAGIVPYERMNRIKSMIANKLKISPHDIYIESAADGTGRKRVEVIIMDPDKGR